jgi:uncharacterized protein
VIGFGQAVSDNGCLLAHYQLSEAMHSATPGQILKSNSQNPTRRGHSNQEKSPMENHTQDEELKAHLLSSNEHFRTLAEQHAQLKHQVEEIESKSHVTEQDEIEEQRLKKLKLHVKDQMLEMVEQYKHASVH